MRIHMLGHASLLVETEDRRILFDPVLGPHHQEGLFEVFPPRTIDLDAMPPIDTLVVTHRHLDHFDIPSLALLDRSVQVLIPRDEFMRAILERLGFQKIAPLREHSVVRLGATTLMTTGSDAPIHEFGVVLADRSGVLWNAVDSIMTPEIIAVTHARFPTIDVLIAPWQPLLEAPVQGGLRVEFPAERYGDLLRNIDLVAPSVVIPGANGYAHIGEATWLDSVTFPVTRERFCADVERYCPELEGAIVCLDPGDIFEVDGEQATVMDEGSSFISRQVADRRRLDFAPVELHSQIVDTDPYGQGDDELHRRVSTFFGQAMTETMATMPHAFAHHRRERYRYQVNVVFPSGEQRAWSLDCSTPQLAYVAERDALATSASWITASGLIGLVDGEHSWHRLILGGTYRTLDTSAVIAPGGLIRPRDRPRDPLMLALPETSSFERARLREVERALASRAERAR